jgi:hypothetical protein
MSSLRWVGDTFRMFSRVRQLVWLDEALVVEGTSSLCSLCIADAVTVSLVCDDSIRAVSVWNRRSVGDEETWYRSSQPIVSTGAVGLPFRIRRIVS